MSDAKEVNFSLRVMLNKQKNKVLFAEADNDFIDVLLSFLTLPLGTIVRILGKHYGDEAPVVGSLTTLYKGLQNLSSNHFSTESGKQMLLNPRKSLKSESCKLKLNIDDTQPRKYLRCEDKDCIKRFPIGIYYNTLKCDCGKFALSKSLCLDNVSTEGADDGDGGVYTASAASFIISDDLQILPSQTGYIISTLRGLGMEGTDGTELRNVTFGFNEVMDLLKGSLLSQTPFTDILSKRQLDCATVKYETHTLSGDQIKELITLTEDFKMTVKAIVQESTNRLLFVEADDNFIEFLFSLLTIPLGGAEYLLGGSTCLKNIDNLYKSVENITSDKYLKKDTKTMLLEPELPVGYISESIIFPLYVETCMHPYGDVSVLHLSLQKGREIMLKGQECTW